jgi:penicillin amidase
MAIQYPKKVETPDSQRYSSPQASVLKDPPMNFPKLVLQLLYGKRLPITSGQIHLNGPEKTIHIHRDQYGIPYIEAQTETDAYYALGFCQGQDRPFQLETLLRLCRGTLAELVGEPGLRMDRLARRIGFYRYGQGHFESMASEYKQHFDAFARGITDGVSKGCPKPAHGFALLRTTPTPWTGADVLAGANYVSLWLSSWTEKLSRLIVLQMDGIEALKALHADYADWLPTIKSINLPAGPNINRLVQDLGKLGSFLGIKGASNNWVLDPSRTGSGRPIVANDPHLAPTLPAPWYLVHMQAPGLKVAGASFLSIPFIPSGHNQNVAWGVTASLIDNIDLYIEEMGEDGKTVREGDQFVPVETITERYDIKDADQLTEDILITRRGPIISDMLEGSESMISMCATWMKPRPPHGMHKLHHASSVADCKEACQEIHLASQNLVYADTQGDIGWTIWGEVPDRRNAWGVLPLPGWDDNFSWKENFIPTEQMPSLKNPSIGYIATANAKIKPENNGIYLGHDFIEGYRHARIVEVLNSRSDWDLPGMLELQTDQFSIPWREMKDAVFATPVRDDDGQLALNLLKEWDGITSTNSAGAAVYAFFIMEMDYRRVNAIAPKSGNWALGQGFHPMVERSFFPLQFTSQLVTQLAEQPEGWFEDGWPTEVAAALSSAVRRLRKKMGSDPTTWGWGKVHQLNLLHTLGVSKPLARVFNRGPFPSGGDHHTVAQAGRSTLEWGANVTGLANLRTAWDVGQWEDNHIVIVGGQSGNPFSPHYDDLLQFWLRGEAIQMPWSQEEINQRKKQTLQLIPEE